MPRWIPRPSPGTACTSRTTAPVRALSSAASRTSARLSASGFTAHIILRDGALRLSFFGVGDRSRQGTAGRSGLSPPQTRAVPPGTARNHGSAGLPDRAMLLCIRCNFGGGISLAHCTRHADAFEECPCHLRECATRAGSDFRPVRLGNEGHFRREICGVFAQRGAGGQDNRTLGPALLR